MKFDILKRLREKRDAYRKKQAEKKEVKKEETVKSLRQKFYDFGGRSMVIVLALLLSACSLFGDKEVIYTTIYPSLPPLQEPNVLTLNACEWTYPANEDEKVFIGMDEKNFKCYVENKEIVREQMKLYQNFVKEVNLERENWSKLNEKSYK